MFRFQRKKLIIHGVIVEVIGQTKNSSHKKKEYVV